MNELHTCTCFADLMAEVSGCWLVLYLIRSHVIQYFDSYEDDKLVLLCCLKDI